MEDARGRGDARSLGLQEIVLDEIRGRGKYSRERTELRSLA